MNKYKAHVIHFVVHLYMHNMKAGTTSFQLFFHLVCILVPYHCQNQYSGFFLIISADIHPVCASIRYGIGGGGRIVYI